LNPKRFVDDWGGKSRPNFVLFDPCKIRVGLGEMSECIIGLPVRRRTHIGRPITSVL